MQLVLRPLEPAAPAATEMVERKGLGHPDTICDALAEEFSLALSRHYLERFDRILHHNVDKVLLSAGSSSPRLGGGEAGDPIDIFLAGRATTRVGSDLVPVVDLGQQACETWIRAHLRYLDPSLHVRLHCLVRPGSAELTELFAARTTAPLANDTSLGVGFAPLSPLERTVLEIEGALNAPATKRAHPALGEDVKVMATRTDEHVDITVACAMVDRHVADPAAYMAAKQAAASIALRAGALRGDEVSVSVNHADDLEAGRIYLTVTGTSAEAGDDGQTGRGNRANGLITPYRPMTMESVCGKNPVTHVGKLYNVAAQRLADALCSEVEGIDGARVHLVSQIGRPITDPALADVWLWPAPGASVEAQRDAIETLSREHVARIDTLWQPLLDRDIRLV
jgi:S-adenosylmethionine synthetase